MFYTNFVNYFSYSFLNLFTDKVYIDIFVNIPDVSKMAGRKSLFIFLMNLAWKCRFSMPLLLSGTVALLGQAWMFQIRVHTVHRLRENEVFLYF